MSLYVTILAAGQGKRMKSDLPKVLHLVSGIPMIIRVLREVFLLDPQKIFLVVSPQNASLIHQTIVDYEPDIQDKVQYAIQDPPLGTGHAVKATFHLFDDHEAINLIVHGDNPMLSHSTLSEALKNFTQNKCSLQITTINASDPSGSGRVMLTNNKFDRIIEERDCTEEEKKITLINCGVYVCHVEVLVLYIPLIQNNNAQSEYYLTDLIAVYRDLSGQEIGLFLINSEKELEFTNINTKEQLYNLNQELG